MPWQLLWAKKPSKSIKTKTKTRMKLQTRVWMLLQDSTKRPRGARLQPSSPTRLLKLKTRSVKTSMIIPSTNLTRMMMPRV